MRITFFGSEPNIGNKHFLLTPSLGIFYNLGCLKILGIYLQWGYWWAAVQVTWSGYEDN